MIRPSERLPDIILSVAAIGIAITFAHREFSAGSRAARPSAPTFVRNWTQLVPIGDIIGSQNAPVKIVEFGDFECPFCKAEDSVYRQVARAHGSSVALVFVHFPLHFHRFAMPAARAAECAAAQGRFAQFHDLLYDLQDSLGLKSWSSYARDASIQDTLEFGDCIRSSHEFERIEAGVDAAKRFNIHGTPTVLVNGWQFPAPPDVHQLDSAIAVLTASAHRAS